jgi:hypothetical protein
MLFCDCRLGYLHRGHNFLAVVPLSNATFDPGSAGKSQGLFVGRLLLSGYMEGKMVFPPFWLSV